MTYKSKKLAALLAFSLAMQAATFQPLAASAVGYRTLSSEAEVITALAGKTLTSSHYTLKLNADFSFEGSYQGRPMFGKWMFVSTGAICLDMYTSIYCRTPKIMVGDITNVRFERDRNTRNRVYFPNPYPNLWAQYTMSD